MPTTTYLNLLRVTVITAVFSAGYLCGSVEQHNAEAQLGDIGSDVLKRASEQGGAVGTLAKMGTALTDMEKHVSALQKNLDTLKAVKATLGGGTGK